VRYAGTLIVAPMAFLTTIVDSTSSAESTFESVRTGELEPLT
jgi:hypothetical protein